MNINATLLGQALAFAIFVWLTMKFIWPPIMAAIHERQKKIADGLAAAERGQHDLQLAQEKVASQLREVKQQAAGLIDQANKRATQIVDQAKDDARKEADRILAGAQAEITREITRAKEHLRAQVSVLALTGAEKILQRSIDASAHEALLSQLSQEL